MDRLNQLLSLYTANTPISIKKIDTTRNGNDKRYTILVCLNDTSFVIKAAKNSFTNVERVLGWQKLCQHYNDIGIYCPLVIANKNGNYSELVDIDGELFTVYAEEIKKYKCVDEFEPKPPYETYEDKVIETIGIVA